MRKKIYGILIIHSHGVETLLNNLFATPNAARQHAIEFINHDSMLSGYDVEFDEYGDIVVLNSNGTTYAKLQITEFLYTDR